MNPVFDRFPRLNNRARRINAALFEKAGYPMAAPSDLRSWKEIHVWCAANFRNAKGVTYCWTGEKFWFQNEEDRRKFADRFCATRPGHAPGSAAAPERKEGCQWKG